MLSTGIKKRIHLFLVIILSIPVTTLAQDYSYRHYSERDGLSGPVVYSMCQDKDGFMWFATETGVSRFDGSRFTNFTTSDGLPGNAIISLYCDAMGRVWFIPFKHAVCYYYKGRIHNQQNDPLLKKLTLDEYVIGIGENSEKEVILMSGSQALRLTTDNQVLPLTPQKFGKLSMVKMSVSESGVLRMLNTFNIFRYDKGRFHHEGSIRPINAGAPKILLQDNLVCWMTAVDKLQVRSARYGLDYTYTVPPVNTLQWVNDSIICINSTKGAFLLNIIRRKIEKNYLPGRNVSCMLTDSEGGTWLATLNDGIYRISSDQFRYLSLSDAGKFSIYHLEKDDGRILVGSDVGCLQIVRQRLLSNPEKGIPANPVTDVRKKGDLLVMSSGQYFHIKRKGRPVEQMTAINAVKDFIIRNDRELLVAGSNSLHVVDLVRKKAASEPWVGRLTCLLLRNDSIYFGTLHGLHVLTPDSAVINFGNAHPLLKDCIVKLTAGADGTIWVGTDRNGIIGWKNDRVTRHINRDSGLSSNTIRCITTDGPFLWVGTDRGLNRIDLQTRPAAIARYLMADGLASDIINTVLIDSNTVYAGTQEGITYFSRDAKQGAAHCSLKLTGITINGREADVDHLPALEYGTNNIRLEYAGISFKGGGDVRYYYRLKGLDTVWKQTSQTALELISLPPGRYTLELYAVNRLQEESGITSIPLVIKKPFWQSWWFILLAAAAFIFLVRLIVRYQIRKSRRKEAERLAIEQQLQELEQKALRAQMNPHFIFNCLHAVQEFIMDHDTENANRYLGRLARLIRQTLDISLQPHITIEDEVQYLDTYLKLEQMRLENRFTFSIIVDPAIDAKHISIPGMLLQPYVENAVQHGIRHIRQQQGIITVRFELADKMIICSITDNGVGRSESERLKTGSGYQYVSRGTQLTEDRIAVINKSLSAGIKLETTDLPDNKGTRVIICFPLILHEKK